jgi:1-deoxy-D-xylulose-5-phosphate synthase
LPNVVIMAPSTEDELRLMLRYGHALHDGTTEDGAGHDGPVAIRYPRGASAVRTDRPDPAPLRFGKAQVIRDGNRGGVAIVCVGICCDAALAAAEILASEGINPTVVNARFVRPLDAELIEELGRSSRAIVTVEEHSLAAGFGSAVLETLADKNLSVPVVRLGIPDAFVGHASQAAQRAECGLDAPGIANAVRAANGRTNDPLLHAAPFA